MRITSIQQAKKNENRVNIYLDDQFWVGLDKDELLKFELFKGKELNEIEKKEIEHSSSLTKILNKTINYILIRPRSEKEIRDYLYRKQVDSETSSQILQKLREKKLVSDEEFAKWYIENRIASGRYGEVKIKAELIKKGVKRDIIESIYSNIVTEEDKERIEENALEFAKKSVKGIKAKNKYEFRNKLIKKLMSRGYKYDLAIKIVNTLTN